MDKAIQNGGTSMNVTITNSVKYIGVDDTTLDLFESQYVIPDGVSYNSYVILDEKIAVMDTVDKCGIDEWERKLLGELKGRNVDYLVIQHLEPDHTGGIVRILELFSEVTLVGNQKTFLFLSQFFHVDDKVKKLVVKEKDTLSLGEHTLTFYMATMVHWPEVMVTYDSLDRILFSADGFGKFGALKKTINEEWACEARRYYFNIVGKYGVAVQALLSKVKVLDIQYICPLHGPILGDGVCAASSDIQWGRCGLDEYLRLYDIWSSYQPESEGVLIAYASIHGNTATAAETLADILRNKGVTKVVVSDLTRVDMAEVIEDAFRYDRMIVAAASYDAGVVPQMREFLQRLESKNYQNRKIGIVENGTWSPSAGRTMRAILDTMKNLEIVEPQVTIYSTMKQEDEAQLEQLAEAMK